MTSVPAAPPIPIPSDPALPALAVALDGGAMAAALAAQLPDCASRAFAMESCQPSYARYKPGTGCLIEYRLRLREVATGAAIDTRAHLRLYADRRAGQTWAGRSLARLVERAARRHPRPPLGRAAYLPRLGGIVQLYPVDPDLPALVRATAPKDLCRALGEAAGWVPDACAIELVRYKPGRKALLRCRFRGAPVATAYAKLHADDRGVGLLRSAGAIAAAGVTTPPALAYYPAWRLIVHTEAAGQPLAEEWGTARYASRLGAVAAMLARLHAAPAIPLPPAAPTGEAGAVLAAGQAIGALLPKRAAWATRLALAIAAPLADHPAPVVPIHGDFYDDQVLVGDGEAALIDFDEARLGHPLGDVGNFLAHLALREPSAAVWEGRDAFLGSYPGDTGDVALFEAAALLKLAVGPFRRLEADWPARVERIAALAEERLVAWQPRRRFAGSSIAGDPGLPQLALLRDRELVSGDLARLLAADRVAIRSLEVVRHKPGRRCLLRYDIAVGDGAARHEERLFAKTFASDRGALVHAITREIAAARACGPEVRLPAPIGYLPVLKLLVQRELPGEPIAPRLLVGDRALARRVAGALGALHASGLALPRRHDLARELAPLRERVGALGATCPALAPLAGRCLALVASWPVGGIVWRWRPAHRDFYHDQLLADGDRLAVLDFDDAAMSEPAVDVANFLAHLRLLGLQQEGHSEGLRRAEATFAGRMRELDPDLDPALLRLLEGATLLRLAAIHLPRERGRWLAEQLLTAAACLLQPGG